MEIQHPELPKVDKWSTIERLNKEKTLIGIFLSAHPLDEWSFEINEMCNITAAELNQFETWKRPEVRKAVTITTDENGFVTAEGFKGEYDICLGDAKASITLDVSSEDAVNITLK